MWEIYPPGHYERFIQAEFIVDHCGIDLDLLGKRDYDRTISVNLDSHECIDLNLLKNEIHEIVQFVDDAYEMYDEKPIWYKINVIDQAVNEYVGIGFLNRDQDWLKFIIDYLSNDQAEQSGDTIFVIFDNEFKWAVSFTLSPDNCNMTTERFRK